MTLQQLKYIIQIVQCGSITMAAQKLYITQPSLSKAVSELEQEMGITIFLRSNRGVILSEEGTKFLSYARQVVEQAELLEQTYKYGEPVKRVFAVSSQHYAFAVNAFVALIKEYGKDKYEFSLQRTCVPTILLRMSVRSVRNWEFSFSAISIEKYFCAFCKTMICSSFRNLLPNRMCL